MSKTLNCNQLNAVHGEGCLVRYGKLVIVRCFCASVHSLYVVFAVVRLADM
jgi:hypothetical protein